MSTHRPLRMNERGQATILVVLAMGIFLLGALGLAIDGSQLYAQRQMAQAAADAAAEAGILSLYNCPTPSNNGTTCSSTRFAYQYVRANGFGQRGDAVHIHFRSSPCSGPSAGLGLPLSPSDLPNKVICVSVSRTVETTFLSLIGPTAATIRASAMAGILSPAGSPTIRQVALLPMN
jgi:uncharacterized membrane protein